MSYPQRIDIPVWGAVEHSVGAWAGTIGRQLQNQCLSFGAFSQGGAGPFINDEMGWKVALKAGVYSLTLVHTQYTNNAIYTMKLDSTILGTIDGFNGGAVFNAKSTLSGWNVPADGVYTIKVCCLSKNASSTNYFFQGSHLTLQRLADIPLMAYHVDWPGWSTADVYYGGSQATQPDGANLGGGRTFMTDGGLGPNLLMWRFDCEGGTYMLTHTGGTGPNQGIVTVQLDPTNLTDGSGGTTVGTFDSYAASSTYNVVNTLAGIVIPAGNHLLCINTLTKNPSASAWYHVTQWMSLDRTGA